MGRAVRNVVACWTRAAGCGAVALILSSLVASAAQADPAVAPGLVIQVAGPRFLPQLGPTTATQELAFSPDGAHLVMSGGLTSLWDVSLGIELARTQELKSLRYSKDGHRVYGVAEGGVPVVWSWETGDVKRPFADATEVDALALCEDAGLLVGVGKRRLMVWSLATGAVSARSSPVTSPLKAVAATSTCNVLLTADEASTVSYWNAKTAGVMTGWNSPREISALALAPSGYKLALGHGDGTLSFWGLAPPIRRTFMAVAGGGDGFKSRVFSVAFSKDETRVVSGANNGAASVWEFESGQEVGSLQDLSPEGKDFLPRVLSAALSPTDPKIMASSGYGKYVILWDITTSGEVRRLGSRANYVRSLAATPDFHQLVVGSWDGAGHVWDLTTGQEVRRLHDHKEVIAVAISADGKRAVTGGVGHHASLWDLTLEGIPKRLATTGNIEAAAFVGATNEVLLGDYGAGRLWTVDEDPPQSKALPDGHAYIPMVSVSRDGRLGLTDSTQTLLWDLTTGARLRVFPGLGPEGSTIGPSVLFPSGRFVVSSAATEFGSTLLVWDARTGERIKTVFDKGQLPRFRPNDISQTALGLAVSPDESLIFTGYPDGMVRLWRLADEKIMRAWPAHDADILTGLFSEDGRYLVTGSMDGAAKIWRTRDGTLLATLVSSLDGASAVLAPDGRFDTTSPGGLPGLSWVMPDAPTRPLSPELFRRDYFEPRLLSRLLACDRALETNPQACRDAFLPLSPIAELNRVPPAVRIVSVSRGRRADEAIVEVEVGAGVDPTQTNRRTHTDAYDLRLFRDGRLVGHWPEVRSGNDDLAAWRAASRVPVTAGQDRTTHRFTVALPTTEMSSTFSAYAFNEDRVKGPTVEAELYSHPPDVPRRKPRAFVINIGVDGYHDAALNLSFAVSDARLMQQALGRLPDYEVRQVLLTSESDPAAQRATKAAIKAVFSRLAGRDSPPTALAGVIGADQLDASTPDDIVIITYSGHGFADRARRFYLVPSNAGPLPRDGDLAPPSAGSLIGSEELSEWMEPIQAEQIALIIDACHAAGAVEAPGFKPGPMGDRGLGQLAYDKGIRILAATQASDFAVESDRLGQGLLTFALVREGLGREGSGKRRAAKDYNDEVSLEDWLKYGAQRTVTLYEEIRDGRLKVKDLRRDPTISGPLADEIAAHVQTPALYDYNTWTPNAVRIGP